MAYIWIKTTNDEYEFIVAMGDTAEKLAKECGTSERALYLTLRNTVINALIKRWW